MNELIRFDWAIKRILRDKANYVILEGLLTALLDRKITIKSILESEGNQEYKRDKFNRVDLLAEDDKGELMIFEIQNERELDYFHRMTYGVCKAVTEYINLGQDYDKIRKVYSINIVYFDLGQGNDYVYRGRTEFRGLHQPDDILHLSEGQQDVFKCDTPSDIMPEYYLLRVDEFDKVATTPLDEWISFLKTGEIPAEATAPGLPEARERMRITSLSDKDRRQYYHDMEDIMYQRSVLKTGRYEGRMEGLKEGRTEGLAEGRAKEKIENARNLKVNGVPLDVISKSLNISIDELKKL